MDDLIHITATYSNAVLVALLPYFSDYSQSLQLPIPTPITTNQIEHFVPGRRTGKIAGHLVLTNGYEFWFSNGYVDSFNCSDNFFQAGGKDLSIYRGSTTMNAAQAVELVRNKIKALGLDERKLSMNIPPEISTDEEYPFFQVEWIDPVSRIPNVIASVDGRNTNLVGLFLCNTNLWRPHPKISLLPELKSEFQAKKPPAKPLSP